ncbi:MAG: hypothetical protein ACRDTG_14190 [Pseudonocardiaceae bacterium]
MPTATPHTVRAALTELLTQADPTAPRRSAHQPARRLTAPVAEYTEGESTRATT